MKLQTKSERWQCAITSVAMALDMPLADVLRLVGHDGGEKVFPDLEEPKCRRGHSIHELIEVCLNQGYAVTPVPMLLAVSPDPGLVCQFDIGTFDENWLRFTRHLAASRGVIECGGPFCSHMVAYDRGRVFDPDGREFDFSREACERLDLIPYCLWRFDRIAA